LEDMTFDSKNGAFNKENKNDTNYRAKLIDEGKGDMNRVR
jgi:hypothetical protein